jgi:hypothetical protein
MVKPVAQARIHVLVVQVEVVALVEKRILMAEVADKVEE